MITTAPGISILLLLIVPVLAFTQETAQDLLPSRQILDEIRSHDEGAAVWWTGHNGWLIKADGILIGTDLVLDAADRIHRSPVTALELAGELQVSPAELGEVANELKIKIIDCQLGCFGKRRE